MPYPVANLRAFLAGRWRISRRIGDVRLGIIGRLTGYATFAPATDGLAYDESGDLRFGSYLGHAIRRYHLVIDRPTAGEMRHADGTRFHELDLASGTANILHHCARDCYRGKYRILHENCFVAVWQVTGPRKDYRLATLHTRIASDCSDLDE